MWCAGMQLDASRFYIVAGHIHERVAASERERPDPRSIQQPRASDDAADLSSRSSIVLAARGHI